MSSVTMKILDSNYGEYKEIEELINVSGNGSLFHRPRFLSYHGPEKFRDQRVRWRHYLFCKGTHVIAFLPGALIYEEGTGLIYKSPFGASCGGLVYGDLAFDKIADCTKKWWEDIMALGVKKVEVVLPPSPYFSEGGAECFEFELVRCGLRIENPDLSFIVKLRSAQEFPMDLFRSKARNAFNKAKKHGVTVEHAEDFLAALDVFYPILLENQKRFNATPTHSRSEILRLKDLFPENIHLFLAQMGKHTLCGILIFCVTPYVINTFYIADIPEFRGYQGLNALAARIYIWARDQGVEWIDFGPSTFGLEPHFTLIKFKESLGCRGYLRHRYLWSTNTENTRI